MNALQVLLNDDSGQGLVEYALIIALVGVASILALQYFGKRTSNQITNDANSVGNALN